MDSPKIKKVSIDANFRYLWMKYINNFNLNYHCAKCLTGHYSKAIENRKGIQEEITLNEFGTRFYYLCGVVSPYKWENNFHLAFVYQKGSTIAVSRNGITIYIVDAKEIEIRKMVAYDHPSGSKKEFNTCRNWQFAYQQSRETLDLKVYDKKS